MDNIHFFEIQCCQQHPDMEAYKTFSAIPPAKVSEASLVSWLVSGGKLEQIWTDLRTEPVLWTAVRHDPDAYELIHSDDVSDHRKLSLEALKNKCTSWYSVPQEHKDEQFLIDATEGLSEALKYIRLRDDYPELITERTAQAICSRSISQAFDFCQAGGHQAEFLFKDEYLKEGIKAQTSDYGTLKIMGKSYLLIGMLADGFWPDENNFQVPDSIKPFKVPPANPAEALERILALRGGNKILHRCWLQTQPFVEVIEALQGSKKGLDELFEIYPERELREHMKSFRALRGRFLEHDLGM